MRPAPKVDQQIAQKNAPSTTMRFVRLPDGRLLEYFKCGHANPDYVIVATPGYLQTGFSYILQSEILEKHKLYV